MSDLDRRMQDAGMIPLSKLINEDQPIDKWRAHTGVKDPESFELYLKNKYEEFMRMRMEYELGDKPKDDLYEWVFSHGAAFGDALVNCRAMRRRMAQAQEGE